MSEVVLLLTPIHTGTHFVRLLVAHPSIRLASEEDYRIDPRLRPGTFLPGIGEGCYDETISPDRESDRGTMLIEYFEHGLRLLAASTARTTLAPPETCQFSTFLWGVLIASYRAD